MGELITIKNEYIYKTNDLTREMDNYLIKSIDSTRLKTYIYDYFFEESMCYAIRFPGATRGFIRINEENIIKEIKLYDDLKEIYENDVINCFRKYIGMKLIIK